MLKLILTLLLIASVLYYIYFSLSEGKDERGKAILYITNSVSLGFILVSLGVFQLLYRMIEFELASYMDWSFFAMAATFTINSILILILRRGQIFH